MKNKEEDAIDIGRLVWAFDELHNEDMSEYQRGLIGQMKDYSRRLIDDIQILEVESRDTYA